MKESQNAVIMRLLNRRTRAGITQADVLGLGIFRLAARICELRAKGHAIQTEMVRRDGYQNRFARYRLKGGAQ